MLGVKLMGVRSVATGARFVVVLAIVLGALAAGIMASLGALAYSADVGTVLNVPLCLLIGAASGASFGGLIALVYGSHVPRAFCLVFAMGIASAVCMVGYGAFSMTYQAPWAFLEARQKEQQILYDAVAIMLVVFGLIVGAGLRLHVTEFGKRARLGAALGILVALPTGPFFAGLVNPVTLPATNAWGVFLFMSVHALVAAIGVGTLLALTGGVLDCRLRRCGHSHSLENQRTHSPTARTL